MRKHKLVILCLLTALLLMTATTVGEVYLTGTDAAMTGSTTVRLVIPASYTVQIPAAVDIPYGTLSTPMTIGVSSMQIGSGKAIEIAVDSAEGALIHADGSHRIPFVLWEESGQFSRALYTGVGETQLHLDIVQSSWAEALAGEYAGSITFHVSVVDQEVAE